MCICVYGGVLYRRSKEVIRYTRAGVIGNHALLDVGTGDRTQDLCRISICP